MRILCRDPQNLKLPPSERHWHECKNGPSETKPNTHVCFVCWTVFDVLPGEEGYIEAVPA